MFNIIIKCVIFLGGKYLKSTALFRIALLPQIPATGITRFQNLNLSLRALAEYSC
jgi:hypothetical protein